jgi:GntR family transcriptional repressor for pyruvate dehydrogenase complex
MQLGRQTLSQAVSGAVLDRIRAGEFRPGDRLPTERSLMEEYGVGRNSVREAVQALVTLGLVDVRPGRGATVIGVESRAAIDPATFSVLLQDEAIDDLYAFRRLLEVEIASRAALVASDRDLEDIATCLHAFDSAVERGRPSGVAGSEIHAAIARASHNAVYVSVLDAVNGLIANARLLVSNVPWAEDRAREQHHRLYAALCAHDREVAAAVMSEHMDTAVEAIAEGRTNAFAERGGP